MVKLVCAVVGEEGSAFPVDIESTQLVGDLKDVIATKQKYEFAASKLQLFLAKKDDAWLAEANTDIITLEQLPSFVKMMASLCINNDKYFGKDFTPDEGDIHVLVKLPSDQKVSVGLEIQDSSHAWVHNFLSAQIPAHSLPAIGSLSNFIKEDLPVKIGMQHHYLNTWSASPTSLDSELLKRLFVGEDIAPCGRFKERILSRILEPVRNGGRTEYSFVCFWDEMVRYLLEFVFSHGIVDRNTNRHSSTGLNRPDLVFTLNAVCVFRGEEKEAGSDIKEARRELCEKLIWSYGDVPYMLGYAVAGYNMELYAMVRGVTNVDLVLLASFQLDQYTGRVRFLLALLKLCLLFQSIADICPDSGRDEYRDVVRSSGVVVRLNPTHVEKVFPQQSIFDVTANHLEQLYACLEKNGVPNVDRLLSVNASKRSIMFEPRGTQMKPVTMLELFRALRDILEALVVLHQASWMHRDIRWPNVMKSRDGSGSWFLIDFVDSQRSPQHSPCYLNLSKEEHAPELTKNGGHDIAVDIWSIGYLIQTSGDDVYSSWYDLGERTKFVKLLMREDPRERPSAQDALDKLILLEQQYKQTQKPKRRKTA